MNSWSSLIELSFGNDILDVFGRSSSAFLTIVRNAPVNGSTSVSVPRPSVKEIHELDVEDRVRCLAA